ncbi:MAG: hypothetical protein NWR72_21580 [Bacteroidia bacterium]|nr:hypothetical protein [Bacteroidia bacterium]
MKNSHVIRVTAILLLFGAGILSSCGVNVEFRTDLLTDGTWKIESLTSPDADPAILAFSKALLSLAEYDYSTNGTYEIIFADTSFSADPGTWEFSDVGLLYLDRGTDDEQTLTIHELTKDNLEYTTTDSSGTYTFVWKH